MNSYVHIVAFVAVSTIAINASDWDRDFYEVRIAPQDAAIKAKQRARKEALQGIMRQPRKYESFNEDTQTYMKVRFQLPIAKQQEAKAYEARKAAEKWGIFRETSAEREHHKRLKEVGALEATKSGIKHRFRHDYPTEWSKYARKHKDSLEEIEPFDVALQRKIQKNQLHSVFSKWTKSFYDYWRK